MTNKQWTNEEVEKYMEEMRKAIQDRLTQDLQNFMASGTSVSTASNKATYKHPPLSPTDMDSRGMYEYQEPEVDEQGTYYGYKILHGYRDVWNLVSPRYKAVWVDGELQADKCPSESTMYGIHCTKRPDHPELGNYVDSFDWVLVKCALSGTIVETEQGYRAEHAQIVGVYNHGNWESYQDYQERTENNYRKAAEEKYYWYASYKPIKKGNGRNWTLDFDV